jgi:S-phase kinase-associated protein 1
MTSLDQNITEPNITEPNVTEPTIQSLDEFENSETIKLISDDNKEFIILKKNAFISNLVKTSLENDKNESSFPVSIKSDVLTEVVVYMNNYQGTAPPIPQKPLKSNIMSEITDDFSAKFFDRIGENRKLLYSTILAANYLGFDSMMRIGCAKVASLIKGQPLDKIRDILVKKPTNPALVPVSETCAEASTAAEPIPVPILS